MPDPILSPTLERPSVVADYIELLILSSSLPRGEPDVISLCRRLINERGKLARAYRPSDDADYDSEQADLEFELDQEESQIDPLESEDTDREIAEELQQAIVSTCLGELHSRASILKCDYPFVLTPEEWIVNSRAMSIISQVYILCLLLSAEKYSLLAMSSAPQKPAALDRMFQACATVAAAGAVGGRSAWFGSPRPEGTNFLKALKRVFEERVGVGSAKRAIPPGLPKQAKDEGIDVIAWRDWPDRQFGVLMLAGQAATGKTNWTEKSIIPDLEVFGMWLQSDPAHKILPALMIPWPAYHELERTWEQNPELAIMNYCEYLSRKNGYVVDRIRIADSVGAAADLPRLGVEGWSELEDALDWTSRTVAWIRGAHA